MSQIIMKRSTQQFTNRTCSKQKQFNRNFNRFNSTSSNSAAGSKIPNLPGSADSSHVLAGIGGGILVLGLGYGYYHYSGAATVVSTAQQTINSAKSAKNTLLANTPSASDALSLLRTAAHTYAGESIPGSKKLIDSTFDQLDSLGEKYGDKLSSVLKESYDEFKDAVGDGNVKDGGEKLIKAGVKVMEKIRSTVEEKGGEVLDSLLEKHPELKESVGDSLKELKGLGDKYGPEAQSLLTSTYTDLANLLTSSKSLTSPDTLTKAKSLLDSKSQEFKKLAAKSSSEAWGKYEEKAEGIWEKVPDLKGEVDERLKELGGWVGEERVEVIKSLYSQLSELSKSNKSPKELSAEAKKILEKQFGSLDQVKGKAGEFASDKGLDSTSALNYLSAIPGVGGLANILNNSDLKHLKELAEKHGSEGEKLLESTYDEIKQLLKKKMDEGKKVLGEAKKDVKDSKDSKKEDKKDEKKDAKKDDKKEETKEEKKEKK